MPSLLNTVRDLERLRQIVGVLARHGFGEFVQRSGWGSLLGARGFGNGEAARVGIGERIRLVLTDLGPSFVKLGQIVSTRPDLVPPDIVAELRKLQDEVPPVPFDSLRRSVEEQLGASIDELFDRFDETPLASASIGQVHRALLRRPDGQRPEVVVKIQRPNIKATIERDIDLLYWMAHAVERSIPESGVYSPVRLVAEFDRAINAELDYTLEADNAERFAKNFEAFDPGIVRFPVVYRDTSSRRVLTLEYLDGRKVQEAVANGANGERIAKNAVAVMVKQIFEDGFFHADPHPGNIIIQGQADSPVIALIDLGLVGRLTPKLRDRTVDLMVAAAAEDHRAIADALVSIGTPTRKIDRLQFEAEVAALSDRYLGKQLKDIEFSGLLRDLIGGAVKYGLEIPPDFVMVGKALMTTEGIGKQIFPELDVFEEVKPYFLKLMWMRYSPERVTQELVRSVSALSGAAADLPLQVQEILDDLRRGDLLLSVQDASVSSATERAGRRLFSGLGVASMVASSAYLLGQDKDLQGTVALGLALVWGAGHWLSLALSSRRERG